MVSSRCARCHRSLLPRGQFCAYCGTPIPQPFLQAQTLAGAQKPCLTSSLQPERVQILQSSIPIPPIFPIWALIVLHYFTLGIFSIVWLNHYHDYLSRTKPDDPTSGRAIGFLFIPFYSLYWIFFTHLRLCERVDRDRQGVELPVHSLRSWALACSVIQIIPYINIFNYLFLYLCFAIPMQKSLNELAERRTIFFSSNLNKKEAP